MFVTPNVTSILRCNTNLIFHDFTIFSYLIDLMKLILVLLLNWFVTPTKWRVVSSVTHRPKKLTMQIDSNLLYKKTYLCITCYLSHAGDNSNLSTPTLTIYKLRKNYLLQYCPALIVSSVYIPDKPVDVYNSNDFWASVHVVSYRRRSIITFPTFYKVLTWFSTTNRPNCL